MMRTRDGRSIGVLEVGRPAGVPVFHFHGSGSSRLEALLVADAAEKAGVRLIALDRPGIGQSDPCRRNRLLDWPEKVVEVADALKIPRFAVVGMSAGGPYALACAAGIPDRLTACGLICAVAPPELILRAGPAWMRLLWASARRFPTAFGAFLRAAVPDQPQSVAAAEKWIRWWTRWMAPADRTVLRDHGTCAGLARAFAESTRQGAEAARREAISEVQCWGFAIENISFENIFLWHGEQDRLTPAAASRLFADALPHCRATFYPHDGHFSTALVHAQEIFAALVRAHQGYKPMTQSSEG
jgi:pimeloyl-ACP methyl ester carboxylesterase